MIVNRTGGLHSLLVVIQIALALLVFAAMVALFIARGPLPLGRYSLFAGVVAVALAVECVSRSRRMVRVCVFERSLVKLHRIALRQVFFVLVGLLLFIALLHDPYPVLSRLFLATYLGTLFVVLLFSNRLLPPWLASNFFRGKRSHKTLLIGTSHKTAQLGLWLQNKALFGFETVGVLVRDGEKAVCSLPVLGEPHDLDRIIREQSISQVIVLGVPILTAGYNFVSEVCNRCGVRLLILSDLDERLHHPVVHVEDDGLQFITMREEPLENPLNRLSKRALDLAISVPVITLVLPWVAAFVWLAQRLRSPGPLIHRQTRAGLQNEEFVILKFRTMHEAHGDTARQATPGDARVFPGARWLRKMSFDELPQFINVLRGEMSVVGPRPHLVEHNLEFAKSLTSYHVRAFVRPGITGLAQVRGLRGEATAGAITKRLAADILYLEHWSLLLDMGIILRTAWQMVFPPKTAC
ncbi:MAG TPA: exopolysaccharide biosynthesis polyprenyl glycosylphosphotransferase [Chthoniobacteraceae bacterium]|jgi:putative colanic acid biosynthesis UDP-glucose lipid carrier transferase|nr:exopolysaccharide biosynthesis polyprenyl glycosylphosphotransferase [Chthoniobacteraceae bacterium]